MRRYSCVVSRDFDAERRRLLRGLGAAAAVVAVRPSHAGVWRASDAPVRQPVQARTRVVIVQAKRALTHGYDADRGALRAMLAAGLTGLAGTPDAAAALARYVRAGETLGLKVNGLAGRNAATHVELVDELSALLRRAGIEGARQIVFDRFSSDLTSSGFKLNERGAGYRCVGNERDGYEAEPSLMPSSASCLARVLTRRVQGVINMPVLKQHMLSGMTGALKNQFGCIHNPNKMHLDGCDPYIAEVNALPQIRQKQRLIVMDALRPVVDGGPSFRPGMGQVANRLILGVDPVAVDTVALGLLDDLRRQRKLPPLHRTGLPPTHIETSARMGLGTNDRSRIDLVSVEV